MGIGLMELLILFIFLIALIMAVRSNAVAKREEHACHEARALAMGGQVIAPLRDGEVARYAGTRDGVAWTLRVASTENAETSRNTTLIWATESVRSDRVLALVGNNIDTSESKWSWLDGSHYRLDRDPTVDLNREMERLSPVQEEIEELRKRESDPQRWFAAAEAVRRRHGLDGQPPPVVTFGQTAREVTVGLDGLAEGFRVFADDEEVGRRIVSSQVIAAISRWYGNHRGFLRIWAGGPDLRFIVSEINCPAPEGFRHLLDLGLLLAQGMQPLPAV